MADKIRELEDDFNEAYMQAWPSFGAWQAEAIRDLRAYVGDIYTPEEKRRLKLRKSDVLNIQLIRRLIKWVAGFQADHRKAIKYSPIEGGDDQTASELTEIASWVLQHSHGYEIISKSFEHALKTALCLVNTFNDANTDTKLDHLFYNQFVLDPSFTRLDLHDCRFGIIRKFITKDQAKILLPQRLHDRIEAIDDENVATDAKFTNYKTPIVHGRKMIAYDEFQERTTKEEIVVINRQTGMEQVWDGTKAQMEAQLPFLLQQAGIPAELIATITRQKETVKVSAFLNNKHFDSQTDPFGLDDFTFTPIWCYYDPEYDQFQWKLQGFVRGLREIQRAESKRMIAEVAYHENSIASGLDFEKGALVDPEDAWVTGTQPRMFTDGALSNNKARDRTPPPPRQGNLELHQILEDSMAKTIGITPEALTGSPSSGSNNDISGLVTQMRIGAGLVGQRGLFDDLSTSQNIIGDKIKKLIQRYPIERIRRILGREPSPEFFSRNFGRYDCVTSEAPLTDTQRNTRYQELLEMKKLGAAINDPAPVSWSDLIEVAPIEMNTEMLKKMQQREQQQMQQRKIAMEQNQQVQNITIELLSSQAEQSRAKAAETPSKIASNLSKSVQNMTAAELNEAKSGGAQVDISNSVLHSAIELGKLDIERQKLQQPIQNGAK